MPARRRLAIIVPRCGPDAFGGAEALAVSIARDAAAASDIEILTTCAADYHTWENVYPEGVDHIDGIPVRRFPVDEPRDAAAFDRLSRGFRYRIRSLSDDEQIRWMRAQGPYSTKLLQYIEAHRDSYDAFVFVSYLYATTFFGLPLARERAILLPLAHDEWPLYLPVWESIFRQARAFVFVSPEERELVQRRFRSLNVVGDVLLPKVTIPADRAEALPSPERRLLYLGRVDASKGTTDLLETFERFVRRSPETPWRLHLAGPYSGPPATTENVVYCGAVDESAKWDLLRSSDVFVMPSFHESLCIALLEAWACARPSLVNGWNPVLVGQSRRSNGGIWYRDDESFAAALKVLDEKTCAQLGRQAQAYVRSKHTTGNVRETLARALARMSR